MNSADPLVARSAVLRFFGEIQPYLLFGAAFTTLGLLAGTYMWLRRRRDALLFWFTVFAIAYGVHLIADYQLLWWLGLRPEVFRRLVVALEILLPLPAFFFFDALGLLGRIGRLLAFVISALAVCLAIATLVVGPEFRIVNHAFVLAGLVVFVIPLLRTEIRTAERKLLRVGLLFFIACALYGHVTGLIGHYYLDIEPLGFVVLIVCLGLVAARRALAQEQELTNVQKELEIAREIQFSILPTTFPSSGSFRVDVRYVPMTSVAGDFYDFLVADKTEAGILVADVSGHGIPAALIASMVKLAASTHSIHAQEPSKILEAMNHSLCGNTKGQLVTAAYVYLNATAGEIRYSAAAHPAMLLLREGSVSSITENGLMLAAFESATYNTYTCPLFAGDRILLYTDGLVEAANPGGEEFGSQRLIDLLGRTTGMSTSEAADFTLETIRRWAASQSDDLTLLVCDYVA